MLRILLSTVMCWMVCFGVFAENYTGKNLYNQLCEVNKEWTKYADIAQARGYMQMSPIVGEQDLLVFHIQALEQIFLAKNTENLSVFAQENRKSMLKILNEYWQRRDCPRNHNLGFRNPVFIDEENRYCAVGYLMSKTGEDKLCKLVQKTNNYIYIRAIKNATFDAWQRNSGLSLDELAWIQPGYNPEVTLTEWNEKLINRKPEIMVGEKATVFMDSVSNQKDWEVFSNIFMRNFMGQPKQERWEQISSKNAIARNIKPNFATLQGKGDMATYGLYKRELYIVLDSINVDYESENYKETRTVNILKWDAKSKSWKTEFTLPNNSQIYTMFEHEGKLYATGGGYTAYHDKKTNIFKNTYHSYMLVKKGNSWQEIKQEYNGYVYGLYKKGKKTYVKSVIHKDFEMPEEETKPTGN